MISAKNDLIGLNEGTFAQAADKSILSTIAINKLFLAFRKASALFSLRNDVIKL